jgi:hypothetical protein
MQGLVDNLLQPGGFHNVQREDYCPAFQLLREASLSPHMHWLLPWRLGVDAVEFPLAKDVDVNSL